MLADISGVVSIQESKKNKRELVVTSEDQHSYVGPNGTLKVKDGDMVKPGDILIADVVTPRNPTPTNVLSETSGRVTVLDPGRRVEVIVTSDEKKAYPITYGSRLKVQEGDPNVVGNCDVT